MEDITASDRVHSARRDSTPGALIVFCRDRACCLPVPLDGGVLAVGRPLLASLGLSDERMSRLHARIKRVGGVWAVQDEGSKNGTFVNGEQVNGSFVKAPHVVRAGSTLLWLVDRLEDYQGGVSTAGEVVGPRLRAVKRKVEQLAPDHPGLLLRGETGSGKELAARWYHAAGPRPQGPLVAVNCAAVPRELAERLFFGAVRGAFSGALDSQGYAQAADGGTLFLDEIGEIDLLSQAKLLRLLETREVTPLGAQRPRQLDLRVVAATHRDLEVDVTEGRFRADLFYRLAYPTLELPPLRERLEEIPFLVERVLADSKAGRAATAAMVESALVQGWPGNVRQLIGAVRSLAVTDDDQLDGILPRKAAPSPSRDDLAPVSVPSLSRAHVEAELGLTGGNISQIVDRLGVSRAKLRRFLERESIAAEQP